MTRKKSKPNYFEVHQGNGKIFLVHPQAFDLIENEAVENWQVVIAETSDGKKKLLSNQIWNTDFVYELGLSEEGVKEANKDLRGFVQGVVPHFREHLKQQKKMVLRTHKEHNQAQLIYLHYIVDRDEKDFQFNKQHYIAIQENIKDGELQLLNWGEGEGNYGRWTDFRVMIYEDESRNIICSERLQDQLDVQDGGVEWLQEKMNEAISEQVDVKDKPTDWIWTKGYNLSEKPTR
jgi:hypothetical protein|tara:strand:+ start:195 stop:896 length:702 start_codon:yes stop_codon:yes gene_type:complete